MWVNLLPLESVDSVVPAGVKAALSTADSETPDGSDRGSD